MFKKWFKLDGIMAWFILTGTMLIGLSIAVMTLFDSEIVNQAGAHSRQASFLRISEFVGAVIGKTGSIQDLELLEHLIQDVLKIRPGILRLSVFEITPQSSTLILSTDTETAHPTLDPQERFDVAALRFK